MQVCLGGGFPYVLGFVAEKTFDILYCIPPGLPNTTIPEIQRCPLSSVVLQLLAIGITNIREFDFMDPPSEDSLVQALEQLFYIGALEKFDIEDDGLILTPLGKKLAHFPLEPVFAKAIIKAQECSCTHEVLTVVAMLSVDSILFTPPNKREEALSARRKFLSDDGDHMTLLNIYRAYKGVKGNKVRVCMYVCVCAHVCV